jgi:hypothetical protein
MYTSTHAYILTDRSRLTLEANQSSADRLQKVIVRRWDGLNPALT